jgi:hypothetical protein
MLYFRNRTRQKSALMSQTETSSASGVAGLAPGTLVEVKGMLRCEEPLTSEFAEKTCAYYSSKVTREYMERDRHDDDDVGSNRRSEVVAQNEQFAPFAVEDDSGSVVVSAEGAEVDARQVVNRFDRNTGNEGPSISLSGAPSTSEVASAPSATATPRAYFPSTSQSTCSAPCRRTAASGHHNQAKKAIVSSSATAPRKRWDRASARPPSGSVWEEPAHSYLVWSCWSWVSWSCCLDSKSARSSLRLSLVSPAFRTLSAHRPASPGGLSAFQPVSRQVAGLLKCARTMRPGR